jgi:membrane fusion protein (multidrug efflux system)
MTQDGLEDALEPSSALAAEFRRDSLSGRLIELLQTYHKAALIGLAALGLLAVGDWQYGRLDHITENDARVMADMVTISSRVDGWVASRPVTDGENVHKDQELVVIDQRATQLQLTELRAKAESVRLQRERTATQLRMAEVTAPSAVAAAEASRAAAEASRRSAASQLEQAQRDYQRADALVADQFIPRQTWDQRRTQLRQAEDAERVATAQLAGAEATLANARAKLGDVDVLRSELDGLSQDAAQIDAQIRAKEIEVADREVRSPVDGVVDQKFVEPGEYVIPGQRLMIVHDPKGVWVEASVKETKLADLQPGQPVSIGVDAYPNRRFTGHIERIGNAATSEFALLPSPNPSGNFTKITQRVMVRVAVEQPADNPLRPGMMVEVDIDAGHR